MIDYIHAMIYHHLICVMGISGDSGDRALTASGGRSPARMLECEDGAGLATESNPGDASAEVTLHSA